MKDIQNESEDMQRWFVLHLTPVSPGCVYVSGQFNERVEPLGEEPVVTLTLWLPARCIIEASIKSRAAGRMWLKSLQVAGLLVFLLLWFLLLVLKLLLLHGRQTRNTVKYQLFRVGAWSRNQNSPGCLGKSFFWSGLGRCLLWDVFFCWEEFLVHLG